MYSGQQVQDVPLEDISSLRRNPVLADVMAQLDYMEKRGSGLKRICNETKALESYKDDRRPVFKSSPSQFMTIIYSVDYKDAGQVVGQVAGQVAGQVKDSVRRLILALGDKSLTRKQIMELLSLKGRDNFRVNYLEPSMEEGIVLKLYPDADNRPDQAYYLTEKGLQLWSELK